MIYSKTSIGYSHIKSGKPCQDFSLSYRDEERTILAVCDGHGGDIYIRSQYGSKFAATALLRVLMQVSKAQLSKNRVERTIENIKIRILCEWNALVEEHLKKNPIKKSELKGLDDKKINTLNGNKIKAYGTTLCGVLIMNNRMLCIQLGDSGVFTVRKNTAVPVFEESEDDPVANFTYSLCDENAFKCFKAALADLSKSDGVILCSDGAINPYGNIKNFSASFAAPVMKYLREGKLPEADKFMMNLGAKTGLGDDVSVAIYTKTETP